jgi:hypothetical protein
MSSGSSELGAGDDFRLFALGFVDEFGFERNFVGSVAEAGQSREGVIIRIAQAEAFEAFAGYQKNRR